MSKANSNLYQANHYNDIREAIQDGINRYSDCIAFTIKNKVNKNVTYTDITYKEFGNQINSLGTGLIKLGLKDKKIAIIGPNSYEWVLSYVSVLLGVGMVVPLDKGLPAHEIENSIIRSDADAIIFDDNYMDIVTEIRQKNSTNLKEYICMKDIDVPDVKNLSKIKEIGQKELENGNKEFIDAKIDADKASIILFTSGTTSLSKAVMLSHRIDI